MSEQKTSISSPPDEKVEADNPFTLFRSWLSEAEASELNDSGAMTLATVDEAGMPDARMVLLKEVGEGGFVFYTNLESAKGVQLGHIPRAALCFHWKSLRRQVRVRGHTVSVSDGEADAYFATRPRGSRIGAWASPQSRPIAKPLELEKQVALYTARFAVGNIARPSYWSGFRLVPTSIEFWVGKRHRLHDRLLFTRDTAEQPWYKTRLYP
ncbi:MAG: pyridoxamine 5'-phosphate oxidase [Parvularculales bacterium]